MGRSFTRFRRHGFWTRDGLLEVWLRCVALHLESDSYLSEHWLHSFRDDLLRASSGMWNGCVSAGLDEHVTDEKRVASTIAASDLAIDQLRAFGPDVPAEFLNALGIYGSFRGDLMLSVFEDIHDTFNALLRGDVDTNPAIIRMPSYPPAEEPK